jgi:hypothetical protein
VAAAKVRLRILTVPDGLPAVSGFRLFGTAPGPAPSPVTGVAVNRSSADRRDATISWQPSTGATGYNIRWGVSAEKLYGCVSVLDATQTVLRFLRTDLEYFFAIEGFGPTGTGDRSETVRCS